MVACVRPEPPVRPAKLHAIVQRHQRPGQHGGQGQLYHHQAVQRGGHQHHDGTNGHLNQTKPDDADPPQHHGATPSVRIAKAAIIMPKT